MHISWMMLRKQGALNNQMLRLGCCLPASSKIPGYVPALFWYDFNKYRGHESILKTIFCTLEITHILSMFWGLFWEFASDLKILISSPAINHPFSQIWFFYGERSSYVNWARVHSHTNNGLFKLRKHCYRFIRASFHTV